MKRIISTVILAGALCIGCMATKHKTTTCTGSVTESSATGFLVTVDGYEDQAVSSDGILTQTKVQKIAGDVAMVQAMTEFAKTMTTALMLASGNTNFVFQDGTNSLPAVKRFGAFAPRAPQ